MERTFEAKWFDPDFRREPKTDCYCEICQRDINPERPHRVIMFELDRYAAIAPNQWEQAKREIEATRAKHLHPAFHIGKIGMDCAKRLGLEWSIDP